MTIGDLGRLKQLLQSDAVISKSLVDDELRKNHGKLSVGGTEWEGVRSGLGLEVPAPGGDVWFGKGGDILGSTAERRVWPSPSWSVTWGVAFLCNLPETGKALTGQLYDLMTGGVPSGEVQEEAPLDPMVELANLYEPFVRRFAERHLARAKTPEDAWRQAKLALAAYPNGVRLAEMLERGELAEALRLLPGVAPTLRILHRGASVLFAWPNSATDFQLQQTRSLAESKWTDVTTAPVVVGDEKQITAPLQAGERYYRLHKR
jgi:hypothetical protein